MSESKFKTYCRIMDYLRNGGDKANERFADLLDGTCASMAVSSTAGKPGITLLIPQDAKVVEEISKLAYSANPEDAAQACNMLHAMVFRDYFGEAADWKTKPVINSLHPAQMVDVESASGNKVTFKSGASAERDPKFVSSAQHKKLAVWKLTGKIPVTTDKPATTAVRKNAKKGAYEVTPAVRESLRWKIGLAVENEYAACMGGRTGGLIGMNVAPRDVYLEYTLSLVAHLMDHNSDVFYERVLPLLSFHHIDFYNLVEPHKFQAPADAYIVPDYCISEWWNRRAPVNCTAVRKRCRDALDSVPSKYASAACYANRDRVFAAIDRIRRDTRNQIDAQPRECVAIIARAYESLSARNSIGDVQGVYPAGLAHIYASEPDLKLAHDELRYVSYLRFCQIEQPGRFDIGAYREIIQMIAEYANAASNDRQRTMKVLNPNIFRYQIFPRERLFEAKVFVNSTQFLFVPMNEVELHSSKYKDVTEKPTPEEQQKAIFNLEKAAEYNRGRLLSGTGADAPSNDVLNALRSMQPESLSPAVRAELQRLVDRSSMNSQSSMSSIM